MATDETSAATAPRDERVHHLPHSHGGAHGHNHTHDHGRPHLHLAETSGATATSYTPGVSILRTSIFVRLGFAVSAAILIWAAFHWATR